MAIETKQVEVAKEMDDVMVLVCTLVRDIKAKKSPAELASGNLKNLMDAISGLDQIAEEATHKKVALQTIGYRVGDLADALIE